MMKFKHKIGLSIVWTIAFLFLSVAFGADDFTDVRYNTGDGKYVYVYRFQNKPEVSDVVFKGVVNGKNIDWKSIWEGGRISAVVAPKDMPALPSRVKRYSRDTEKANYIEYIVDRDFHFSHAHNENPNPIKVQMPLGEYVSSSWQSGNKFPAVSLKTSQGAGAWLVRREDMKSVKISTQYLETIEKTEQNGIVRVKGARPIDTLKFDLEASWEPRGAGQVIDSSDKKINALEYVKGLFEELEDEGRVKLPLTARDQETASLISKTLSRQNRASITILGEAGTGKSALAKEAMADLPRTWVKFKVEPGSLSSGARYTGMFDQRVNAMIEASKAQPIIWFMDEIHSLKGQGTHSESSSDIFEKIKPYLADGTLRIVGTDTEMEYNETFTDPALRRRMMTVVHEAPTHPELLEKISGWLKAYGYPEQPADQIEYLIKSAFDFNPSEFEPSRSVGLLEATLSMMVDAGEQPLINKKAIDRTVEKYYRVDPAIRDIVAMRGKVRRLPEMLNQRLIGQDNLKRQMIERSKIALANLHDGVGPRISMYVSGPPGIGKTEIAKAYADAMGLPYKVIEMSRYGAASVLGSEQLMAEIANALRANPFTVIIFDEIEKAHGKTLESLLTFMSADRFTSYEKMPGATTTKRAISVYSKNCTAIFTANAGSDQMRVELAKLGAEPSYAARDAVFNREWLKEAAIRSGIPEPLMDRIQVISGAYPPSSNELAQIIELHLRNVEVLSRQQLLVDLDYLDVGEYIEHLKEKIVRERMSNRDALHFMKGQVKLWTSEVAMHDDYIADPKADNRQKYKLSLKPDQRFDVDPQLRVQKCHQLMQEP